MGDVVSKQTALDKIFIALSHPLRRKMLRRLLRAPASSSDLSHLAPISVNSMWKHVVILERAGFLQRERRRAGHRLTLCSEPYDDAVRWLDPILRAGLGAEPLGTSHASEWPGAGAVPLMTDIENQIRDRVQTFVDELTELVRESALDSVAEALGKNGSRTVGGRARKGAAAGAASNGRARRKGEKRSASELQRLQDRLLAAIKANPGLRKEQLAAELRASSKDLMLVTNKLLDAGAIRKRGVKRATTYYPR